MNNMAFKGVLDYSTAKGELVPVRSHRTAHDNAGSYGEAFGDAALSVGYYYGHF